MESWLYGDDGYYRDFKSIGREGDFYTAVSASSVFGASIANHLYKLIVDGRAQRDGWLIEIGAHQGYLLCDMIQWLYTLDPELVTTLKFGIVERQPEVRKTQQEYIHSRFGDDISIEYFDDISAVEVEYAFVVANEIFDAFACNLIMDGKVAKVEMAKVEMAEVETAEPAKHHITWHDAPQEMLDFASTHRQVKGEIAVGYEQFATDMAAGIASVDFVSFDYGERYVRNDFSIRIYREHETLPLFDEELVLGEAYRVADITYDVNFGHVIDAFEDAGFETIEYETQARALIRFGLIDILEQFAKHTTQERYLREADKVKTLISPTIMGDRFKMVHFRR